MGYSDAPSAVVVTLHAIQRLRLRIGRCRLWSQTMCEQWITHQVKTSAMVIHRANGDIFVRAAAFTRTVYFVITPSANGSIYLVKTALPHVFAETNLNRRCI